MSVHSERYMNSDLIGWHNTEDDVPEAGSHVVFVMCEAPYHTAVDSLYPSTDANPHRQGTVVFGAESFYVKTYDGDTIPFNKIEQWKYVNVLTRKADATQREQYLIESQGKKADSKVGEDFKVSDLFRW